MKREVVNVNVGDRFGFLEVLDKFKKNGKIFCRCKCRCGTIKDIDKSSLTTNRTKSCGCYNRQRLHETHTKGNFTNTRLYHTWENMKARCYNPKHPEYKNYGDRGIKVCDEWKQDFLKFREWALNNGWNEEHSKLEISLDRIDVNGNYEPSNCRWSTYDIQVNNQRRSRRWEYQGVKYTLLEISEKFGINHMALRSRLYTQRLDVKTAIEKPLKIRRNGKCKTI